MISEQLLLDYTVYNNVNTKCNVVISNNNNMRNVNSNNSNTLLGLRNLFIQILSVVMYVSVLVYGLIRISKQSWVQLCTISNTILVSFMNKFIYRTYYLYIYIASANVI